MFKKLSKKKGFTLMEMMIVVAIIAILIAIIVPTFKGALDRANAAADEANLRAYYAEQMANAVLEDKDPVAPKDTKTITVSGVEYKLHGSATFEVKNHQLIITYTPESGSTVTIPGTTTTKIPASGDTSKTDSNP